MSKFTPASLIFFLSLALAGGPAIAQVESKSEGGTAPELQNRQNFFELDPFNIPVIRGDRIRGQVTFSLILELTENVEREAVHESLPRLRHAFFLDLKGLVDRHKDIMRTIKLKSVKKTLLERTAQILGKRMVRAILVQGATIHRY